MADWILKTTEEDIAAALEAAKDEPEDARIVQVSYHPEPNLNLFVFEISDGRRLVFPRENMQYVADASKEEAAAFTVGKYGDYIWWPQLDEGFRLEGLLEGRTGNEKWMAKLQSAVAA